MQFVYYEDGVFIFGRDAVIAGTWAEQAKERLRIYTDRLDLKRATVFYEVVDEVRRLLEHRGINPVGVFARAIRQELLHNAKTNTPAGRRDITFHRKLRNAVRGAIKLRAVPLNIPVYEMVVPISDSEMRRDRTVSLERGFCKSDLIPVYANMALPVFGGSLFDIESFRNRLSVVLSHIRQGLTEQEDSLFMQEIESVFQGLMKTGVHPAGVFAFTLSLDFSARSTMKDEPSSFVLARRFYCLLTRVVSLTYKRLRISQPVGLRTVVVTASDLAKNPTFSFYVPSDLDAKWGVKLLKRKLFTLNLV